MTEHLDALLDRYADAMAAHHVTPAPPPAPRTSRPTPNAWLRRAAFPVLAAASVATVAVGASVLPHHGGRPAAVVTVPAHGGPQPMQPGDTVPPPAVLGPRDITGIGGTPAPAGRADLTVTVELPSAATMDELTAYTAVLSNPSGHDVPLRPCPTYRMELGGQVAMGRLPCDDLPQDLGPGQTLRIGLEAVMGFWDGPDTVSRDIDVTWAIAGPAATRERLTLQPIPLGPPVATAPFLAAPAPPGEPVDAVVGSHHGLRPEWRLTPTIIDAPSAVRAGETLRYTVRLFNVDPKEAVPLAPCRGFTEWLQRPLRPAGEQVAFLDWSFERHEITSLQSEEHLLNCQALPEEIPPRRWVQLEMELKVPADYPPGSASLAWKVGELDVFGSMQSRYVTVNIGS